MMVLTFLSYVIIMREEEEEAETAALMSKMTNSSGFNEHAGLRDGQRRFRWRRRRRAWCHWWAAAAAVEN